jgi:hypothetical protein
MTNQTVSALFAKQIEDERDELAGYLSELIQLCFSVPPGKIEGFSSRFIEIEQATLPHRVAHYMRKKKREEKEKEAAE